MLEDAQRQASRAGRTIADETLLLFASTAMLTSECFPRVNDNWEERAERNKTWSQWNTAYKRAHAKERVKTQANDGSAKFGAANSAACQETANSPPQQSTRGGRRRPQDPRRVLLQPRCRCIQREGGPSATGFKQHHSVYKQLDPSGPRQKTE